MIEPAVLAKALRDHLGDSGESQAQFAARAGVSEPTISRLLNAGPDKTGAPQMRPATLEAVLQALPRTSRKQLLGEKRPRSTTRYVFLSSTFLDNEARRRHIIEAIESFPDLKCIAMERFSASSRATADECLMQVMDADLFIGILAYRYGWIPDDKDRSITELEHDCALRSGIDRLMFVVDEHKRPLIPEVDADPMPQRWELQARLSAFKQRLSTTGITPRTFASDEELIRHVMSGIVSWRERQQLPAVRPTEVQVDPLHQEELRYRDALLAEHRYLRFVGFTSRQRAPMRLEDLFVPLLGQSRIDGSTAGAGGDKSDGECNTERIASAERNLPLVSCLASAVAAGKRGVVIAGRPGVGKTTHVRRLTFGLLTEGPQLLGLPKIALHDAAARDHELLPVYLPLRSIRQEDFDGGLAAVIARASPEHARLGQDFAERLLERGHLLFLIDGLDEAPPSLRALIPEWLESQIAGRQTCYFILTTRPAGYSEAARARLEPHAIELEVAPLSDEQITEFVQRWYRLVEVASTDEDRAVAEARGANNAQDLIERLHEPALRAARVMEMTANPLLLTIICLVHRDGSYLPDDAAALYQEASQVLLESWRRAKGLDVAITADKAMTVLRPLAFHLHQQSGRTAATAAELKPSIEAALRSVGWQDSPDDFLAAIRDESGMLVGLGDDRYGFLHLGFQEYFAALDIHARVAEHALDEDRSAVDTILDGLAQHFGDSWWREVILLLLRRADPPHLFAPFLRAVVDRDVTLLGSHAEMLDACLRDTARRTATPFVHALSKFTSKVSRDPLQQAALLKCAQTLLYVDPSRFAKEATTVATLSGGGLRELLISAAREHDFELPDSLAGAVSLAKLVTRRLPSGVEMVRITGGKFRMGGSKYADEKPIHGVELKDFWIARTPVTNAQYQAFVTASGYRSPDCWKYAKFNGPDQPVVGVSWDDAVAFCRWAGLRLPSEAEWEYACRANTTGEYSFEGGEHKLAEYAWYSANSGDSTHAVGLKPANAFGLHDMHGNVLEWCQDTWHESYKDAPRRGEAWEDGGSSLRVLRGGSWHFDAEGCRSASRGWGHAGLRLDVVGFRPASSSLD
ncbi:MAG: SUMF1/EgtB/PvdO family nonheme iron enzyme [Planctomycetota bacterium]